MTRLMDESFFDELYRREQGHWWFAGRRRLAAEALRRWCRTKPRRLLDMGCGTGGMLAELQQLGTEFGLDIAPTALTYCRSRGHARLALGRGEALPVRDATVDAVVSLDVLEHIEDDRRTLGELYRICANDAVIVITVPAVPWLWTTRDDRLLHKRRYTRAQLVERSQAAGFVVEKCSYYCAFFFPIVAAVVAVNRLGGRTADVKDDVPSLPPVLNALFRVMLRAEQWLMRWVDYPVGVSLFCVLRKSGPLPREAPSSAPRKPVR